VINFKKILESFIEHIPNLISEFVHRNNESERELRTKKIYTLAFGEMAEWLIAPVLKTGIV